MRMVLSSTLFQARSQWRHSVLHMSRSSLFFFWIGPPLSIQHGIGLRPLPREPAVDAIAVDGGTRNQDLLFSANIPKWDFGCSRGRSRIEKGMQRHRGADAYRHQGAASHRIEASASRGYRTRRAVGMQRHRKADASLS